MTHWLNKKLVPLVFAIVFSVVGFGTIVNIASADIIGDLSEILPLDAKYLPGPGRVAEIPSDITASQAQLILTNIKNDGLVQVSFKRILAAEIAVSSAQNDFDYKNCSIPGLSLSAECRAAESTLRGAKDALDTATAEIESALVLARERQDLIIESYRAQNAVTEALTTGTTRITDTAQTRQTTLVEQGQNDIANTAPVEFTPEYINAARQAQQNASAWNTDDSIALKMQQDCVVWSATKATNLMPCFAEAVYKIIYKPTAYALMGSGYIFDQILSLSLEGEMVAPPFINSTWIVVRDFSNMIFIFILLYTGIQTIFGVKGWEKVVRNVIIIALLINFSLFFTKVVIDAGNVLAVGIKSAISTTSVSEGLAAAFQPQQFLSAATKGPDTSGGDAIIVFLVAAVVSGFAAYIFFYVMILFMGRIIISWGLMIISPFAFISMVMPKGNIFNKWLDTLMGQTFIAPVFLFFVYIIMKVISGGTGILGGFQQTDNWFKDLLGPVIVATLLIFALKMALGIAEDMAGKFGGMVAGLAGQAIGVGAMVASGGTSALGRGLGGRLAQKVQESGTFQKMATGESAIGRFAGRQALTLTDKARTGTWDARGTKAFQTVAKTAGLTGKATGILGIEKPGEGAKGGFKGVMERQDKRDLEEAKKYKVTDQEKEKLEGSKKEKVDLAQISLNEKKSAFDKAEKEEEASRTSGVYDQNLKKVLEIAEKEKIEAEKKLEEEKKKDLVAEENERRRKVHAQYIEGRAKTTTMAMGGVGAIAGGILAGPAVAIAGGIAGAGLYRGAYSHTQAKRSAEKIRTTKIKDLEEKEKEEKDATKIIMKILEKEKKVEEKPKAETEGGDKH